MAWLIDRHRIPTPINVIFAASCVDTEGAVAAWEHHNAELRTRTEWLNAQRFSALHSTGPGYRPHHRPWRWTRMARRRVDREKRR